MVIFDIKGLAFSNKLDELNSALLFGTTLFFYLYNNISTHYDIKHRDLNSEPTNTPFLPGSYNYNPTYIKVLKFIIYWLVIIYGSLFFEF